MSRKPTEAQTDAVFDQYLDSEAVAALVGTVSPATVRSYALRGIAPAATRYVGRTPLWLRSDIVTWMENRVGQGVGGGRPRGSMKKKAPGG